MDIGNLISYLELNCAHFEKSPNTDQSLSRYCKMVTGQNSKKNAIWHLFILIVFKFSWIGFKQPETVF